MIGFETARDIAFAHREVEAGEELLKQMQEAKERHTAPDIRDAFGRQQNGLQLGVPSGQNGHRLYNVAWDLAVPVVEAHIAASKSKIRALTMKAKAEIWGEDYRSYVPDLTFIDDPHVPGPLKTAWSAIAVTHGSEDLKPSDTARAVMIALGYKPVAPETTDG